MDSDVKAATHSDAKAATFRWPSEGWPASIGRVAAFRSERATRGAPTPQASQACGIGRATVAEYLVRAQRAGVLERAWETWSGEELEQRLYPAVRRPARRERPEVDWLYVHNELKYAYMNEKAQGSLSSTAHP